MQCLRVCSDTSTSCQHSATEVAAGTSTATCFPCCIAYTDISTWLSHGVQIYTRSMSSRSQSLFQLSSPKYSAAAGFPALFRISCDFFTRSSSRSQSATVRVPSIWVKRDTALGPLIPSPMKPILTVSIGSAANCSISC